MRRALLSAVIVVVLGTSVALAATKGVKPAATTGDARTLHATTARLTGTINPKGSDTTYQFDYGPTEAYGSQTPAAPAGAGTKGVPVGTEVSGLTPATVYHFRLVATSAAGTTAGHDRTFTTKDAPLLFTLKATPSPVPYGRGTTVRGNVTGTGGTNRSVVLLERPYPFAAGFEQVGSATNTDDQGNFAFPVPALKGNTLFRVMTEDKKFQSSVLLVHSQLRVRLSLSASRVARGGRVRFSGVVTPAADGAPFLIQRLSDSGWKGVFLGTIRPRSAHSSRFGKRLRIRRSGKYRVLVRINKDGHVSGASRTRRITVVP